MLRPLDKKSFKKAIRRLWCVHGKKLTLKLSSRKLNWNCVLGSLLSCLDQQVVYSSQTWWPRWLCAPTRVVQSQSAVTYLWRSTRRWWSLPQPGLCHCCFVLKPRHNVHYWRLSHYSFYKTWGETLSFSHLLRDFASLFKSFLVCYFQWQIGVGLWRQCIHFVTAVFKRLNIARDF